MHSDSSMHVCVRAPAACRNGTVRFDGAVAADGATQFAAAKQVAKRPEAKHDGGLRPVLLKPVSGADTHTEEDEGDEPDQGAANERKPCLQASQKQRTVNEMDGQARSTIGRGTATRRCGRFQQRKEQGCQRRPKTRVVATVHAGVQSRLLLRSKGRRTWFERHADV